MTPAESAERALRSARDRFRQRIDVSSDEDGCWIWKGPVRKDGYGQMFMPAKASSRTLQVKAHRLAWELNNGPIPKGAWVLHRCDNPLCVNPRHLFLGTHDKNMADMVKKGRSMRGEANHFAKLTAKDVRAIRADLTAGVRRQEIAQRFNVCESLVGAIARREIWRHL